MNTFLRNKKGRYTRRNFEFGNHRKKTKWSYHESCRESHVRNPGLNKVLNELPKRKYLSFFVHL